MTRDELSRVEGQVKVAPDIYGGIAGIRGGKLASRRDLRPGFRRSRVNFYPL